jgi:hypothetical protein
MPIQVDMHLVAANRLRKYTFLDLLFAVLVCTSTEEREPKRAEVPPVYETTLQRKRRKRRKRHKRHKRHETRKRPAMKHQWATNTAARYTGLSK